MYMYMRMYSMYTHVAKVGREEKKKTQNQLTIPEQYSQTQIE